MIKEMMETWPPSIENLTCQQIKQDINYYHIEDSDMKSNIFGYLFFGKEDKIYNIPSPQLFLICTICFSSVSIQNGKGLPL